MKRFDGGFGPCGVERLDYAGTGSRLHVDLILHDLSLDEWSSAAANWSK